MINQIAKQQRLLARVKRMGHKPTFYLLDVIKRSAEKAKQEKEDE